MDIAPNEDHEWLTVNGRLILLGQMAAGVAHELNNPLTVILGFAQSLVLQPPHDAASLASSLASIEREAHRCQYLIHDLLTFSRSPKPMRRSENLVNVLQGSLSLVKAQAHICRVQVMEEFSVSPLPVVMDRHRIQQLVINLCINAIDAMPNGGILTVGLSRVQHSQNGPSVEIVIKDTGVGMSPETIERIFESFFTTKESGKGTGLGLSLVQEIVKEHNGSIYVCSEVGKGTSFFVKIPATADKLECLSLT